GEQLESGHRAGGAVGHQALGAELAGERCSRRRQQRVVAAGDQQAVGERAAVRLLEQPLLQQHARQQPLAADARGRNVAAVGELVELLLVQMQEGGGLARGEAGAGGRSARGAVRRRSRRACRARWRELGTYADGGVLRSMRQWHQCPSAGRSFAASTSSSRVLMLRKAASSSSKLTSTTFSVPYQRSILRPPPARKAPRCPATSRRHRQNTGCGWSKVFATASWASAACSAAARRSTRSAGRKGESQGAVTTSGCRARMSAACSPASGPAKPPMSSPNTG